MENISEFIVESIDTSEDTWKFFNNIQGLKEIQTLDDISKKFTSLATNATIFRWKFGDQPGNPTIETTVNPYIYTFHQSGTYSISHQSCYPCISTGTLVCSSGWCTKSIEVVKVSEPGAGPLVALAGLAGLFIISKEDNCCELRKRCVDKRTICANIKPEDIKNTKECNIIEKTCITRLENCRNKCIKTGNKWEPSFKCLEKTGKHKEICQTIESQKNTKKQEERSRKIEEL